MAYIRIDVEGADLAVRTPYNSDFLDAFKQMVPAANRKWDKKTQCWLVSTLYGAAIQNLIFEHFGVHVSLPVAAANGKPALEIRLCNVRYIGAVRQRLDGSQSAFGWTGSEWEVIFPKSVLLKWFGQEEDPDEALTLYAVLGVPQTASTEELRKAWKRLILQWHPDRNHEPDAAEQFITVQQAYETLSNPVRRVKYDAGLALEASVQAASPPRQPAFQYRCPLRNGLILVKGTTSLGRFVVSQVLEWSDIVNAEGCVLVSYWSSETESVVETWVQP